MQFQTSLAGSSGSASPLRRRKAFSCHPHFELVSRPSLLVSICSAPQGEGVHMQKGIKVEESAGQLSTRTYHPHSPYTLSEMQFFTIALTFALAAFAAAAPAEESKAPPCRPLLQSCSLDSQCCGKLCTLGVRDSRLGLLGYFSNVSMLSSSSASKPCAGLNSNKLMCFVLWFVSCLESFVPLLMASPVKFYVSCDAVKKCGMLA